MPLEMQLVSLDTKLAHFKEQFNVNILDVDVNSCKQHVRPLILNVEQDAREAMRVFFSVLTKRICMHKTNFLRIYSNIVLKLILNCMNMQITTQLIMMYNL